MIPYYEPWTEAAVCREVGGDGWFPEPNDDWNQPRKICMSACPVLMDCRDSVMRAELGRDHKGRYGVWAGMSPLERKRHEPEWLAEQEASAA